VKKREYSREEIALFEHSEFAILGNILFSSLEIQENFVSSNILLPCRYISHWTLTASSP
jgi:hypothetical protein